MVSKRLVVFVVIATLFWGRGNSICVAQNQSGFTLPEIPAVISDVNSRRAYLAQHYWDNFNFESGNMLENGSLMGVAIGGYIEVLKMNPSDIVEQSIDKVLMRALESGYDNFEDFTSKFEDYLYNPNSPMRNEELYIYVLRYIVYKAPLDEIYKVRSHNQLAMVLKNRIGQVATDFSCYDGDGKIYNLHQIESTYTILFFNTPDCDDCARVKNYIAGSKRLTEMVHAGLLTILGIYAEKDMELWRSASYPSIILNTAGAQGDISKNRLYDLKALPTLYLLDSNKRVILKDRSIEEIEGYLCNSL